MTTSLNLPLGTRRCYFRSCSRYFSTVGNFDKHRKDGECVDPAKRGLIERDGVWGGLPPAKPFNFAPANPAKATVRDQA